MKIHPVDYEMRIIARMVILAVCVSAFFLIYMALTGDPN